MAEVVWEALVQARLLALGSKPQRADTGLHMTPPQIRSRTHALLGTILFNFCAGVKGGVVGGGGAPPFKGGRVEGSSLSAPAYFGGSGPRFPPNLRQMANQALGSRLRWSPGTDSAS